MMKTAHLTSPSPSSTQRVRFSWVWALALAGLLVAVAACSDDNESDPEGSSNGNTSEVIWCEDPLLPYFDEATNSCVAEPPATTGTSTTSTTSDTSSLDVGGDTEPDTDLDTSDDVSDDVEPDTIDPACDQDQDGVASFACGGNDCDDNDFKRSPQRAELCDYVDNNCNEQNNENIDCTFYAHTGEFLYRVDPFAKIAIELAEVPNLFDIDTHPDGTLYGITGDALFYFDDVRAEWFRRGNFNQIEEGTGLAIDSAGTGFVTAGDSVYTVNLITAQTTYLGPLGGDFFSSGDCVVNKRDTLFMTSKAFDEPDELVIIDRANGRASLVGSVGFSRVYALTAGWGFLFGLNSRGELIEIDPQTGQGTLLHTFEDKRWYGAASSPGR